MFLFNNKVHKTNSKLSKTNVLKTEGYIILDYISQGSFGEVRQAKLLSEENDLNLVVKIIDTNKTSKEYVSKFLPRELDVIRKINHPYIIHTHSILQKKAVLYVFMVNAKKGELLKYIMNKGPLKENQARIWFRQLSLAVQYLHTLDIVHRDIKCENIVITENYTVKLTDFGFSKFINKSKRLNCDTYCCSIPYASPEVLSKHPYDGKLSDIWSLGVVLFVMLNKKMPFSATNIKLMHKEQVKRNWIYRTSVDNLMSENLRLCIDNILQPEPRKRWTINNILESDWIKMNTTFIKMNEQESLALREAIKKKKIIYPKHFQKIEVDRSYTQQILNGQPSRFSSKLQKMESTQSQHDVNVDNSPSAKSSTQSQHTVRTENLLLSKISTHSQHTVHEDNSPSAKSSTQSQHTVHVDKSPTEKSSIYSQHTVHVNNSPSAKSLTESQHSVHAENLIPSKIATQSQHSVHAKNLIPSKTSTQSQHSVLAENLIPSKISTQSQHSVHAENLTPSQHSVHAENLIPSKILTQLQHTDTVYALNSLSSKSINNL